MKERDVGAKWGCKRYRRGSDGYKLDRDGGEIGFNWVRLERNRLNWIGMKVK